MDEGERTAFIKNAVLVYRFQEPEVWTKWLMDNAIHMTHKDLAIVMGRAIAMYADRDGAEW